MNIQTYKNVPVVVKAIQLINDPDRILEVLNFIFHTDYSKNSSDSLLILSIVEREKGIVIPTAEGKLFAEFGDYVVRGPQGGYYPCKPDAFEEGYMLSNESK